MGNKIIIAIIVAVLLLLAVGLGFYFYHPPSPAHVRPVQPARELVGVGLQIRMNPQTSGFVIDSVLPNSPAAAAGIASGLTVSKVNDVSLAGKSLAECANLVRGPVGSSVKLELVAPDGSRTNTVELTRQKLKL